MDPKIDFSCSDYYNILGQSLAVELNLESSA